MKQEMCNGGLSRKLPSLLLSLDITGQYFIEMIMLMHDDIVRLLKDDVLITDGQSDMSYTVQILFGKRKTSLKWLTVTMPSFETSKRLDRE